MESFRNSSIIGSMEPEGMPLAKPSLEEREATLYLAAEENNSLPELLFFEEQVVQDPGWRRASQKGRRLWQKVKDRYDHFVGEAFAGDRFIRRIQSFRRITVLLNQPIEPVVVKAKLKRMLRDRSYHHLRWMIIDLLLLPLALFPMFLPGPNVIGYYLLFRFFSHWKSYRSARNANLDQVDIVVSSRMKEVSSMMAKAKNIRAGLHELRQKYGLRALQEHQFVPQSAMFAEAWSRWKAYLKQEEEL